MCTLAVVDAVEGLAERGHAGPRAESSADTFGFLARLDSGLVLSPGAARPKGDPDDTAVLRKFVAAVLAVEPAATGPAVMLYEAGNTILRAFMLGLL